MKPSFCYVGKETSVFRLIIHDDLLCRRKFFGIPGAQVLIEKHRAQIAGTEKTFGCRHCYLRFAVIPHTQFGQVHLVCVKETVFSLVPAGLPIEPYTVVSDVIGRLAIRDIGQRVGSIGYYLVEVEG